MSTATPERNAPRGTPLDLSQASEQEIVAAFADEAILTNPPRLPPSISAAIDGNRKILSGAMGVIDAWNMGGDSRLAPLSTGEAYHPDLMKVLSTVRRMVGAVAANHRIMAELFPVRKPEDQV